eukprot:10941-Heterococcus_DN1.PRE.1
MPGFPAVDGHTAEWYAAAGSELSKAIKHSIHTTDCTDFALLSNTASALVIIALTSRGAQLLETVKVCYSQLLIATGARCRGINVTRAAADFPSKSFLQYDSRAHVDVTKHAATTTKAVAHQTVAYLYNKCRHRAGVLQQ